MTAVGFWLLATIGMQEFGRSYSIYGFEIHCKALDSCKAYGVCYFRDPHLRGFQQCPSTLDADGTDKLCRSLSGDGHEFFIERGTRHSHLSSHRLNREFRIADILLYQGYGFFNKLFIQWRDGNLAGFNIHLLAELPVIVLLPFDKLLHTQSQHFRVKWFGQIVVGTQLQSFNAAYISGTSRQQDDGDVR